MTAAIWKPAAPSGNNGSVPNLSRNALMAALLFLAAALCSIGCAPLKIPMEPRVGNMDIVNPFAADAALLITEENKSSVLSVRPESFTGGARSYDFPMGQALETASLATFSQMFQHVVVVRTDSEAQKYDIVLEPTVEDFHFRFDEQGYSGFALAVYSRAKVQVSVKSKGEPVWKKAVESPEQKKGPWDINFSYENDIGESASNTLVYDLRQLAMEMYRDAALRKTIEGDTGSAEGQAPAAPPGRK